VKMFDAGKTRMIGLPYGETSGQSNLTKVTPGGRKLYH